jgi:hypothetical protein
MSLGPRSIAPQRDIPRIPSRFKSHAARCMHARQSRGSRIFYVARRFDRFRQSNIIPRAPAEHGNFLHFENLARGRMAFDSRVGDGEGICDGGSGGARFLNAAACYAGWRPRSSRTARRAGASAGPVVMTRSETALRLAMSARRSPDHRGLAQTLLDRRSGCSKGAAFRKTSPTPPARSDQGP